MDYFKTKSSYQEIDPLQQSGRNKFLHNVLIGAFTLCIGAIVVLVLVNTFTSPVNSGVVLSNDPSGGGNVLRASAPGDPASVPSDPTSVPSDPASVPSDPASVPSDPASVPSDPASVPSDPASVPSDPASVPSDPASVPSDPASVPSDPASVPSDPASVPSDPASVPSDPASVPSDPASVPSDPASVPTDPASVPSDPASVPSDSSSATVNSDVSPIEPAPVVSETVDSATGDKAASGNDAENIITTEPPLEDILLELNQGSIIGKRMTSRAGREYLGFLGIPYAKPPLGELRFMPPVEADTWNGTLNATQFQPECIQENKYITEIVTKGSEDCLYINIYTPKTLADLQKRFDFRRFPVMVYIHGGGQYGSATRYGADYFMDEDVVLVIFHYRLGILGNLNTNDMEARGNQGLKDQVMALQWVQDNIKKFGGSKRKVTLFGNSYGGMDITAHMLSQMSKGLFKQVICQSGVIIMPGILTKNPLEQATKLGKKLNCVGNTTNEIVSCFRKTDAKELILSSYLMEFETSIEPPADTDDVFLSDNPINILQDGQLNRASAMFGVVSGEGLSDSLQILTSTNLTKDFNENWEILAAEALYLNNSKDTIKIANAARSFYLGSNNLSREFETNFTAMFSDRQFIHPANVFASFQLEKNRRRDNVYLYYFNEDADKSYTDPDLNRYGTDEFLGAGHADELQFLFPYDPYPTIPLGSKHANFSQMMVRLWVSFANTGNPTGDDNDVEWLPIEKEKPYKWFELSQDNPGMTDILGDRMNFWDSFNLTDLYI